GRSAFPSSESSPAGGPRPVLCWKASASCRFPPRRLAVVPHVATLSIAFLRGFSMSTHEGADAIGERSVGSRGRRGDEDTIDFGIVGHSVRPPAGPAPSAFPPPPSVTPPPLPAAGRALPTMPPPLPTSAQQTAAGQVRTPRAPAALWAVAGLG